MPVNKEYLRRIAGVKNNTGGNDCSITKAENLKVV